MGTKGYHSYRGRGGGKKTLLVVLLVAALLISLSYLALQDFLVYDSRGNVSLDLPFFQKKEPSEEKETGEEGDSGESLNLIIEEPENPASLALRGQEISLYDLRSGLPQLPEGVNALAMVLKGEKGTLFYQSALAAEGAKDSQALSQDVVSARLGEEREWTAVAVLDCLHDTAYAFANMAGAGICQSSGYIWYDNTNSHWLEPSKEGARDYLAGLAGECVQMGFDEVLLRGLAYPTLGKQYKIDYSTMTMSKPEALAAAITDIREAVGEETVLSLELDETLILAGSDTDSGQDISVLVPLVDRVYVTTEDPDAVWAALEPYVPQGRERESFLVVEGDTLPEAGSGLITAGE